MHATERQYQPCSGQSGRGTLRYPRKHDWGICRVDNTPPWWRARDARGNLRTFPDYAAAERAALRLEAVDARG